MAPSGAAPHRAGKRLDRQWHEIIADATVADAILDRLVHNAYRLGLKGESIRKSKAGLNTAAGPSPSD